MKNSHRRCIGRPRERKIRKKISHINFGFRLEHQNEMQNRNTSRVSNRTLYLSLSSILQISLLLCFVNKLDPFVAHIIGKPPYTDPITYYTVNVYINMYTSKVLVFAFWIIFCFRFA